MLGNLGLTELLPNGANPEGAVNEAVLRIDSAITERVDIDVSAGDVVVTLDKLQSAFVFDAIGATVARTITLPVAKRLIFARNLTAFPVTFKVGTTLIEVTPDATSIFLLSGMANGLSQLSSGSGGGSGGGSDGVEEAPIDGKQYGRQDGEWTEVIGGGGAGGGGAAGVLYSFTGESLEVVPPLLTDFEAPVNANNCIVKQIEGVGISLATATPRLAGPFFCRIGKQLPAAGNFGIIVGMQHAVISGRYPTLGIQFRNAANQRITSEVVNIDNVPSVRNVRWDSDSNFVAARFTQTNWLGNITYFKMEYVEGLGVRCYMSPDGVTYTGILANPSDTIPNRPTYVDLFIAPDSAGQNVVTFLKALFFHFEQYAL